MSYSKKVFSVKDFELVLTEREKKIFDTEICSIRISGGFGIVDHGSNDEFYHSFSSSIEVVDSEKTVRGQLFGHADPIDNIFETVAVFTDPFSGQRVVDERFNAMINDGDDSIDFGSFFLINLFMRIDGGLKNA